MSRMPRHMVLVRFIFLLIRDFYHPALSHFGYRQRHGSQDGTQKDAKALGSKARKFRIATDVLAKSILENTKASCHSVVVSFLQNCTKL